MTLFWRASLSLTGFYGAITIGLAAAISHYFLQHLATAELAKLLAAAAVLAFQTLALLLMSLSGQARDTGDGVGVWHARGFALVAAAFHLGLWLFVYTVLAGLLGLPFYYQSLAPLGGQMLLISWLVLALLPWLRK